MLYVRCLPAYRVGSTTLERHGHDFELTSLTRCRSQNSALH